jgi:5,10-methylene-tetrahydrofolate dehydrogenase/methenyl tetrahydrofolate cyclohydrolase
VQQQRRAFSASAAAAAADGAAAKTTVEPAAPAASPAAAAASASAYVVRSAASLLTDTPTSVSPKVPSPWPSAGGARVLDGLATSDAILRDLAACVVRLRSAGSGGGGGSGGEDQAATAALLRPPSLAVLLATSSRDSVRYVERKARAARAVGFESRTVRFDESAVTEREILEAIEQLNEDDSVDGILVQLPLPAHVSQARVLAAVAPAKDVDGFHPNNMGALALFAARDSAAGDADTSAGPHAGPLGISTVLYHPWERRLVPSSPAAAPPPLTSAAVAATTPSAGCEANISTAASACAAAAPSIPAVLQADAAQRVEDPHTIFHVPCTPKACLELLDRYRIPLRGKHVVVLGRSASVGLPLTLLLLSRCASVSNIDEAMPRAQAQELCRQADVLIAAVGVPEYVQHDWIKPGAAVVDVGINFVSKEPAAAPSASYSSSSASSSSSSSSSSPPNSLINPADTAAGVRLVGDVHAPSVSRVAGALSPVPGGVGPMTVAMLMDNTLRAYIRAIESVPLAQSTVLALKEQRRNCVRQRRRESEEEAKKQQAASTAATSSTESSSAAASSTHAASGSSSALSAPLPHPPAPMLFLSGPPGAGKGTQASRLVADFGLRVRGTDGNDAPTPRSANHDYIRLQDTQGRTHLFGVAHISVGALLRAQVASPSPDLPASILEEIVRVVSGGGILRGAVTVALLRAEVERLQRESSRLEPDVQPAFVIDGFPRSMDNLVQFEENVSDT